MSLRKYCPICKSKVSTSKLTFNASVKCINCGSTLSIIPKHSPVLILACLSVGGILNRGLNKIFENSWLYKYGTFLAILLALTVTLISLLRVKVIHKEK